MGPSGLAAPWPPWASLSGCARLSASAKRSCQGYQRSPNAPVPLCPHHCLGMVGARPPPPRVWVFTHCCFRSQPSTPHTAEPHFPALFSRGFPPKHSKLLGDRDLPTSCWRLQCQHWASLWRCFTHCCRQSRLSVQVPM